MHLYKETRHTCRKQCLLENGNECHVSRTAHEGKKQNTFLIVQFCACKLYTETKMWTNLTCNSFRNQVWEVEYVHVYTFLHRGCSSFTTFSSGLRHGQRNAVGVVLAYNLIHFCIIYAEFIQKIYFFFKSFTSTILCGQLNQI